MVSEHRKTYLARQDLLIQLEVMHCHDVVSKVSDGYDFHTLAANRISGGFDAVLCYEMTGQVDFRTFQLTEGMHVCLNLMPFS